VILSTLFLTSEWAWPCVNCVWFPVSLASSCSNNSSGCFPA